MYHAKHRIALSYVEGSFEKLNKAYSLFLHTPSAKNYRTLQLSMLDYQDRRSDLTDIKQIWGQVA